MKPGEDHRRRTVSSLKFETGGSPATDQALGDNPNKDRGGHPFRKVPNCGDAGSILISTRKVIQSVFESIYSLLGKKSRGLGADPFQGCKLRSKNILFHLSD